MEYSNANGSEFVGRTLVINVAGLGTTEDDGVPMLSVQPLGIVSRPVSPTNGDAAGCLVLESGNERFAMPTTDPRTLARIPTIAEGETAVYAPACRSITHHAADGTIQIIAFLSDTETMAVSLDVANRQVMVRHPSGAMYTLDDNGHNWFAANGPTMQLTNDGLVINGNVRVAGTMGFGALPVLPVLVGPAGPAGVPTTFISVSAA